MKGKPKTQPNPADLRMPADEFDNIMRKALGVPPERTANPTKAEPPSHYRDGRGIRLGHYPAFEEHGFRRELR